ARPVTGAWDVGAYQSTGVAGTPPAISITAPSSGATVSGSSVTLAATASATSPATMSSVQFQVDGVSISAPDTASPYSTTWDSTAVANGSHSLIAIATDSNNMQTSTSLNVTVNNSIPAPSLTSVSPSSGGQATTVPVTLTGTNFVSGATITIS